MRLHRSLHRAVQHRVDVPHGRIGETLAALGVLAHAPAGFQPPVHPLHVLRRDERNLLAAELRLDVVFDIIPVAFQRPRTNRAVLVFRKPAIQPLAQRHAAVLGQLYVLIAFDTLVQFFCQRFLCLCVDVPEDRVAVYLVSYDNAPLPTPIVAFSDHPVSGWPPFSHMQDSFLSCHSFSNNYHAGDRIATSRAESYQKVIICVLFVYGGADFEPCSLRVPSPSAGPPGMKSVHVSARLPDSSCLASSDMSRHRYLYRWRECGSSHCVPRSA